MKKSFWMPFIVACSTMILLYLIGFIANIDFLRFTISDSSMKISFVPIIVGIVIGYMSKRMEIDEGMKKLIFIICTSLLSYIVGFAAYNLALLIIWDQIMGSGDFVAVLFWGGIAFGLFAVPIYIGIIHLIDKRFEGKKGWLYPIGCMTVFFVPTLCIMMIFGGINLTFLFGPEAMLFHVFFLTSGLIFGLCSWKMKRFSSASVA